MQKVIPKIVLATALLALLFSLSLAMGAVYIPIDAVVKILLGQGNVKPSWTTIVWQFRLPKAITATLVGAALSASGLQMQTLFQNPLAGPYVLGVSAGASLGVAILVLFSGGMKLSAIAPIGVVGAACLGAAGIMSMVIAAARIVKNPVLLLVLGLLFGYGASAVVNILLYFSVPEQIQSYLIWTFGSFATVTWVQLPLLAITIGVGLVSSFLLSRSLNLLLLGEQQSQTLGLKIDRIRMIVILNVTLLAGVVTAFCGPIAFVGVAVPHLARGLVRNIDHRVLMPIVMILGACLGLLADLISQMPGQQVVLPLNSVTALIGVPIVAWVILKRQVRNPN